MLFFIGLAVSSVFYWAVIPVNRRRDFLLIASVVILYGLQPQLALNSLNIVLPSATLTMIIGIWLLVFQPTPVKVLPSANILKALAILLAVVGTVVLAPQASVVLGQVHDAISRGVQGLVTPVMTVAILAGIGLVAIPRQDRRQAQYGLAGLSVLVLVFLARQAAQSLASAGDLITTLTPALPGGSPLVFLVVLLALSVIPFILSPTTMTTRKRFAVVWLGLMAVLLIVLKVDAVSALVNNQLYAENGQLAVSTPDFGWLGISYIVFRLAHVLLDFHSDRLKAQPSLRDFITYVIFFPSVIGGPITRVEQVTPQLQANVQTFKVDNLSVGVLRILAGMVKKFALADQLARIAASPTLFTGANTTLSLWIMLYAFLFQFYLDFSGYSDLAIGLGLLFGIRLPENFDRPLLQPNISLFWNSWHITLSQWLRYYWFNPLTRRLMGSRLRQHPLLIVFIAQTSTMILIAMWHHASVNWLAWGLWQGLGLFAFKVLGDWNRPRFQRWASVAWRARVLRMVNIFLTFHYFLLSMAFIAFPSLPMGLQFLLALFGIKQ